VGDDQPVTAVDALACVGSKPVLALSRWYTVQAPPVAAAVATGAAAFGATEPPDILALAPTLTAPVGATTSSVPAKAARTPDFLT